MEDNKENSEIELPELNKNLYFFSEKAAKIVGYFEAITKDGQKIKYTGAVLKTENYKWPDKKLIGEFADNEIKFLSRGLEISAQNSTNSIFELLEKNFELPKGFEDNKNNNFIPKRELSEMPIIKQPEKLMKDQTGWKPPKQK